MKLRPVYFTISGLLLLISIYSIAVNKFNIGIDFTGGAIWEIKTTVNKETIQKKFEENGVKVSSIQETKNKSYLIKTSPVAVEQKSKFATEVKLLDKDYSEVRFETQGPALGRELIQKTIVGAILAALAILLFVGNTFKDLRFGVSAIAAMLHDVIILAGAFSIFGKLFGAEVDALFVTALLTTLSASVHDTVVTFDRIRELRRLNMSDNWEDTANKALSQTIVRSLNNSMTIIIMLTSLVMIGSETTRWFGAALLVGAISGTYSSFAIAVPLVVWLKGKNRKKN